MVEVCILICSYKSLNKLAELGSCKFYIDTCFYSTAYSLGEHIPFTGQHTSCRVNGPRPVNSSEYHNHCVSAAQLDALPVASPVAMFRLAAADSNRGMKHVFIFWPARLFLTYNTVQY